MESLPCDPNQLVTKEESQIQLKDQANRDEYPIILYDPNIDSEEKKTLKSLIQQNNEIELFSKFEEAFKTAQSLGSFLLITPTEVDEEKLLQDFRDLQDTYGRRYFDFEEEAVLKSLFKEISEEIVKSLKVYVFCTHEDFLNEIPANEEEEEVVIKCDIKEMAQQFREEFTIVWCDPGYDQSERYRTLANKLDIEEKNIYTDFGELLKKLDHYSGLPYHLILSGKVQTELIIKRMDNFKDLLRLYIYESPPLKKTRKIKTEKTLEELIPRIIEGVRTSLKYKNTFPAFATQFDDWDKSHINKVHYYLRGFINFKNRRQANKDFINLGKRIYQSKKLLDFEREYSEYNKEQILKWYVAESPIYKLVNNCLRIATSDSITYCRFVLRDLETAIREDHEQQSEKYHGVVYRGAFISKAEFEKLRRNIGKEIEMYGFLSTTTNKKKAENFVYKDIENKVLITIIIPPLPLPEIDEQRFADLRQLSEFEEEEILFNVRSKFQVLEAGSILLGKNNTECRHLVLLYGAQLLRQYITIENPMISLTFKLPLELKCSYCSSKRHLFAQTEETGESQMICKRCLAPNNFALKSIFLLPIDGKVELARGERIKIEVMGKVLEFNAEAKLTLVKTYKCHQCFKFHKYFYSWRNFENGNFILNCLECFQKTQESKINHLLLVEGSTQVVWGDNQGKWEEIDSNWKTQEYEKFKIDFMANIFEKAQENNKCQEFCRRVLQNSVRKMGREKVKLMSYCELGRSSEKLGEHRKALKYHLKALEIQKFIYGEAHPATATSYNDLASVYDSLGEYQKALSYFLNALEIDKSTYGESHSRTATSYNNLAAVYNNFGEYQKALEYFLKALEIRKSIYGEFHPETAALYNNLASVYYSFGEYQKALEYFLKALEVQKSIYGEAHPATATSYNNLASVYRSLEEYQKTLEYHHKALEIRKSVYGEFHLETAALYNNLASVYNSLGKHQKAVEYHLEALKIRKSIYGETHADTAASYNNLGSVYDSLGEYQKAIHYHLEALEIRKSIYGESDPHTATSYNNLASVYESLGEYPKALEYHMKALEIRKSVYGESDPGTASSYNNLALVYESLGEYKKALEYHLKALEIHKSTYGESHSKTATSYNNLAAVYNSLREYQKALKYHHKALEILKSIYGESHPHTASSYNNLALVYESLGEYKKAIQYHLEALEIQKFIYGESHPHTASSYENLAAVHDSLGEYEKALEYHLKISQTKKFLSGLFNDAFAFISSLREMLPILETDSHKAISF